MGTHGSYGSGRFQGTASGNTLSGAITNSYGTYDGAVFTMSADGSITGSYQSGTYERKTDLLLTKVLDYSEIAVEYEPGTSISWTGLWHITSYSYGAVMMAQTGDKVKGYLGYDGLFEGTVSGSTLTAHFLPDQRVGSHITYVFTMSADGKTVSAYSYYGNSTNNTQAGTRISPVTYVAFEFNSADWAKPWLADALKHGLIPDSLLNEDFTKTITRKEFAAVAVRLYENLSGKAATPVSPNPFKDTSDPDILKAFNIGITNGTDMSAGLFSPNDLLNRQTAATMLLRALKAAYIDGWTLATDGDFKLTYTMREKFNDDAKIDSWAYDSVYFMAANKVIEGKGGGMFYPKDTTSAELALGYSNAARQEALIMAVRIVDNLKGKDVGFSKDD